MNENSKVMILIEYERAGIRRASYGEIDENKFTKIKKEYDHNETRRASHEENDENKLDELHIEEENFICFVNDGEMKWIDKEAILSFFELGIKSHVYEKHGMEDASFVNKQSLRIEF